MQKNNWIWACAAVLTWAVTSSVAAAAGSVATATTAAASTEGDTGLEDIVVTARRTEEKLQSTPIAITALTSQDLAVGKIDDMYAIQYSVPDFVVAGNLGDSGYALSLRGQSQTSSDSASDQSVGLYIDGVYIARQQGALLDFEDIQRIEILRGPQGTLFGRNTTGGAVSISTNEPTNDFDGWLRVGGGNYDERQYAGLVNVPVTPDISARLMFKHTEHSGYGRNIYNGQQLDNDDTDLARGSIKIAPVGANWSLVLRGDYSDTDDNGELLHLIAANPAVPALPQAVVQPYIKAGYYTNGSDLKVYNRLKIWGTSATLTVDLDPFTIKSISAYRGFSRANLTDADASPVPYFSIVGATNQEQISEELQLLGHNGNFSWITGLFYFQEHSFERYVVLAELNTGAHVVNKSAAPFAQVNYQVNDALRITAGLRYSWDKREVIDAYQVFTGGFCLYPPSELNDGVSCSATRDASFHYPSYTVSADYQITPNFFLYARTGKADKAGGISKSDVQLEVFQPEQVTDYEVGTKIDLLDRHLRLDTAVFWAIFKDMQRPLTSYASGGLPTTIIQSIGKSRIPGIEEEITYIPVEGLELSANGGLLYPKYLQFADATGDRTHEPFPFVAKQTWGVGATYKLPAALASYGQYTFHTDYDYKGPVFYFPNYLSREPGYRVLNATATLALNKSGLEIQLWGRNLTGTKYHTFIGDYYSTGSVIAAPGDPQTYGATATFKF
jgi:iron complex outermembrane receptor protein